MYRDVLVDGANPGGNLGGSFAANINATQIAPKGAFLDHLIVGLKGTVGTAAVTLESATGALSQFTFKAGQETRIQLGLRDLIALMAAYYKRLPGLSWENTDNTGSTFIMGIMVPIQEKVDNTLTYTYSANYTAVSNFSSAVLSLTAVYLDSDHGRKPIIAVPVPYTTPGSTGATNVGARITNLGQMIGLLVFNTTAPSDGADLYDIQRITLVQDGKQSSVLTAANADPMVGQVEYSNLSPIGEVLQPYTFWEFNDEPIDVGSSHYVEFTADVETTGEATRIIPIVEKA